MQEKTPNTFQEWLTQACFDVIEGVTSGEKLKNVVHRILQAYSQWLLDNSPPGLSRWGPLGDRIKGDTEVFDDWVTSITWNIIQALVRGHQLKEVMEIYLMDYAYWSKNNKDKTSGK